MLYANFSRNQAFQTDFYEMSFITFKNIKLILNAKMRCLSCKKIKKFFSYSRSRLFWSHFDAAISFLRKGILTREIFRAGRIATSLCAAWSRFDATISFLRRYPHTGDLPCWTDSSIVSALFDLFPMVTISLREAEVPPYRRSSVPDERFPSLLKDK